MTIRRQNGYEEFWIWFRRHADRFRKIESVEDDSYSELEAKVSEQFPGIFLELGQRSGKARELILTAHGEKKLFKVIDEIIAHAPHIVGWAFLALKPPLLEEFEMTYEGTTIRVRDIWIRVQNLKAQESLVGEMQIAIRSTNCSGLNRQIKEGALIAIESYLGERAFGTSIEHYEFVEIPVDPESEGFIQLPDLATLLTVSRIQ